MTANLCSSSSPVSVWVHKSSSSNSPWTSSSLWKHRAKYFGKQYVDLNGRTEHDGLLPYLQIAPESSCGAPGSVSSKGGSVGVAEKDQQWLCQLSTTGKNSWSNTKTSQEVLSLLFSLSYTSCISSFHNREMNTSFMWLFNSPSFWILFSHFTYSKWVQSEKLNYLLVARVYNPTCWSVLTLCSSFPHFHFILCDSGTGLQI